jgi:REP element-mobilizing transposase RayT
MVKILKESRPDCCVSGIRKGRTLWKGHLWSSGYYIGMTGTVGAESIRISVGVQRSRAKD